MGKRKKNFGKKLPIEEEPTEEESTEEKEVQDEDLDDQMMTDDEPNEECADENTEDVVQDDSADEVEEQEETEVSEEAQEETVEQQPEDEEQAPQQENCEEKIEENTNKTQTSTIDYLDMARRVQADFDNYRRHAQEEIKKSRLDGQASVIEVFLPCLDTFKEAKKNIQDENILKGFEMVENKINEALAGLGVEKMESIGQKYDPHLHNVIAVMRNDEFENDIILDEYQAGYKLNDKVLRYAKVIVNKKED